MANFNPADDVKPDKPEAKIDIEAAAKADAAQATGPTPDAGPGPLPVKEYIDTKALTGRERNLTWQKSVMDRRTKELEDRRAELSRQVMTAAEVGQSETVKKLTDEMLANEKEMTNLGRKQKENAAAMEKLLSDKSKVAEVRKTLQGVSDQEIEARLNETFGEFAGLKEAEIDQALEPLGGDKGEEPVIEVTDDMIIKEPEQEIEVTDDMIESIQEAEPQGPPDLSDAEGMVFRAYGRNMEGMSEQEEQAVIKDNKLSPERARQIQAAIENLKNRSFEVANGLETKSGSVRGINDVLKDTKEKHGIDLDAAKEKMAVSGWAKFKFGLRKAFSGDLRQASREYDEKLAVKNKLDGEINAAAALLKNPREHLQQLKATTEAMKRMNIERKKPAPTVNVKAR